MQAAGGHSGEGGGGEEQGELPAKAATPGAYRLCQRIDCHDAQRLNLGGPKHCFEVMWGEDSQGEPRCGRRV